MHGYNANKEVFIHQINYFSRFFKVTAFDFLGFGQSQDITLALDVNDYANITQTFLQDLGITNAHFIAHSFGGRVAIKLLSKNTSLANKLVLTGSAGIKPKFSLRRSIKILHYKAIKRFLSPKQRQKYGSVDYKNLSPIKKQSFIKIIKEDLTSHLKYIKAKTLIVCGSKDKQTPLYMSKKINRRIKDSKLVIFNGAGHFAFLDCAFKFNALVKEFLSN